MNLKCRLFAVLAALSLTGWLQAAPDRKSALILLEDATPWSSVSVTVPSVRNLNGTKTSAPVTKSAFLTAARGRRSACQARPRA